MADDVQGIEKKLDKLIEVVRAGSNDNISTRKEYHREIAKIFAATFKDLGIGGKSSGSGAQNPAEVDNKDKPSRIVKQAQPVRVVAISDDVAKALSKFYTPAASSDNAVKKTPTKEKGSWMDALTGGGLLGGLAKLGTIAAILGGLMSLASLDLPEGGFIEKIKGMMDKGGGILKIIGKFLAGSVWKKVFKAGSKVALKGLPGIGALFSFGFAADRFRKGDTVGGVIDLVGGVLDLVALFPPATAIATPLSTGLDILNAYLDVQYGYGENADGAGKIDFLKEMAMGLWNTLKPVLRYIPIVGALIRGHEAYTNFKAGKWGQGLAGIAGTIGNIAMVTGAGAPLGIALMAGADFISSLVDAKDLQQENAAAGGKKMSFFEALKQTLYDNIKKYVGTLPGWVRAAMKRIPGMSEFVGNIETEELKMLEEADSEGNLDKKEKKRLDKLRKERQKKMDKLKDFEEKAARGDYGWFNTEENRMKEIAQLRKEVGMEPDTFKELRDDIKNDKNKGGITLQTDQSEKPPPAPDYSNIHPDYVGVERPPTDPLYIGNGGGWTEPIILELEEGNKLMKQLIQQQKISSQELIKAHQDKSSAPTVINNSSSSVSAPAPRSSSISVDEFQSRAMK